MYNSVVQQRAYNSVNAPQWPGLLFNKAKLLGQLGHQEDAQSLFTRALEAARAAHTPGTWLKACAALHAPTAEQLADMKAAAAYLEGTRGGGGSGGGSRGQRSKRRSNSAQQQEEWGWLGGASGPEQSFLHFALYKVYDAAGYVAFCCFWLFSVVWCSSIPNKV